MTTKVRAVRAGFYPAQRRKPGEVFALREGDKPGSWMELVNPSESKLVEPVEDAKPAAIQGERPEKPEDVKRAIREAAAQVDMSDPANVAKSGHPNPKAFRKVLGWQPQFMQVKAALDGGEE